MRLRYNSPVVLTYTFLCIGVFVIGATINGGQALPFMLKCFSLKAGQSMLEPIFYWELISYAAGHKDLAHLTGNILFIALIGPILEEKYGSQKLFMMILSTVIVTGLLHNFMFEHIILGASGVVFMFIVLVSFTNYNHGDIPLTFVVVFLLYVAQEIGMALSPQEDGVSQFAHLLGGALGALYGFFGGKGRSSAPAAE